MVFNQPMHKISDCTGVIKPAATHRHAHIPLTAHPIREMEDYGLNEAISYANLMIVLFVYINLIHFPRSSQTLLPSDDFGGTEKKQQQHRQRKQHQEP